MNHKLSVMNSHLKLSVSVQNIYHHQLKSGTKMMAMVKANAYGSGSLEVARHLEFHQVDYLAVAYADEGVELRKGGINLPILVLNPESAVFDSLIRYRLEPEIYSLALLQQYAAYTDSLSGIFPIHLKVETGMHRLGFEEQALDLVLRVLGPR